MFSEISEQAQAEAYSEGLKKNIEAFKPWDILRHKNVKALVEASKKYVKEFEDCELSKDEEKIYQEISEALEYFCYY